MFILSRDPRRQYFFHINTHTHIHATLILKLSTNKQMWSYDMAICFHMVL